MNSAYIPQTFPIIDNNGLVTDPSDKANCLLKAFVSSSKLEQVEEPKDVLQVIEEAENNTNNEDYKIETNMVELDTVIITLKTLLLGFMEYLTHY